MRQQFTSGLVLCGCLLLGGGSAAHAAEADVPSIGADGADRNLVEILRALGEASADSASGELGDVARLVLLSRSRDAVREALRNLLPDLARHQVLKQRRAQGRPGRKANSSRGAPVLLASTHTPDIDADILAGYQPTTGIWLQGWTDRAEQDDRDDINGFESDTRGIAIGIDHGFTKTWTLGLSLAGQRGDVDSQRFGADELESREVTAYTSLALGRSVLSASLSYADNEIDRTRVVVVNTDAGFRSFSLNSDIDSRQLAGSLGWTGVYGDGAPFTVSPFASLGFARLKTDDYLESGAGNLSLRVETDDEEELIGTAGLTFGASRLAGNWLLAPTVTVAFEHDFNSDPTRTLSRFSGTRFSFESRGFSIEENRWRFSAGLQLLHVSGFGAAVAVETHRKDDYHYDAAIISLQTQF